MHSSFLLYGANGYLGTQIARLAVQHGLKPELAGRNKAALTELGKALNLSVTVLPLDDPYRLEQRLKKTAFIFNCAGPFQATALPLATACLKTQTHYLDITGELSVFVSLLRYDTAARNNKIMLLPGAGFDVAATDCLALYLSSQIEQPSRLTLAFESQGPATLPPGTQRTAIELLAYGDRIRYQGQLLKPQRRFKQKTIDLGSGPKPCLRITWGDAVTAFHSTQIPTIENYLSLPVRQQQFVRLSHYASLLFQCAPVRQLAKKLLVTPPPTVEDCQKTQTLVWGEVKNQQEEYFRAQLKGPEAGSLWTADIALQIIKKVLAGKTKSGFQTPATAYGADFILENPAAQRTDLNHSV
jgi:short subunit dehydrogenase-like uncharacterized protein